MKEIYVKVYVMGALSIHRGKKKSICHVIINREKAKISGLPLVVHDLRSKELLLPLKKKKKKRLN